MVAKGEDEMTESCCRVGLPPSPPPPLPLTHSPWNSSPQSSCPSGDPSTLQQPHPEAYKEGPDLSTDQIEDRPEPSCSSRGFNNIDRFKISILIYSQCIHYISSMLTTKIAKILVEEPPLKMRRCQNFKLFSPISPPRPMLVNQSYAFIFSQLEQEVSLKFLNIWAFNSTYYWSG